MQQKQIISIKIKNQKKKSTVIITIIKKLGSFSKCNKRKNSIPEVKSYNMEGG